MPPPNAAVVREAVSNVVRDANAAELTVNVTVADELCIQVTDNGRGVSGDITGSGLSNFRQRAEDVGGSFTVKPNPAPLTCPAVY